VKSRMVGRDFLTLMDFSKEEIEYILDTATELKRLWSMKVPHEYLRGRTIACLFEKHSTRTRTSFQAGIAHLGAQSFYMRPDELQLARGEPIKDTARVIDRYCDALVIRTFGQEIVEEFARYMENPVINAMTDLLHPCQGLADLLTIREKKGDFKGLKLAYAGGPYSVFHTLMTLCPKMGIDTYLAFPDGYDLKEPLLQFAKKQAEQTGAKLVLTHNLEEAVTDTDVIYANVWHSMAAAQTKTHEERLTDFAPFQINEAALAKAKGDVIFMHCLPGHRSEEMTDEVVEGPHSAVWDEAENRMHTQKAILSLVVA
jgi:ornithine carbamoyltransferase